MESTASTTPPLPNYFLVSADQRPYGPVTMIALAYAYEDIFNRKSTTHHQL